MDYKNAVREYLHKTGYLDQTQDKNLKDFERDLDFALSKTGDFQFDREAGTLKNVLVGLALAVSLFNAANVKADAFQMNEVLKSMNGAVHGEVKVKSHVDKSGRGNYTIDVGPYTFEGFFYNIKTPKLTAIKHGITKSIDPKAPKENIQKYKVVADKVQELLKTEVSKELQK